MPSRGYWHATAARRRVACPRFEIRAGCTGATTALRRVRARLFAYDSQKGNACAGGSDRAIAGLTCISGARANRTIVRLAVAWLADKGTHGVAVCIGDRRTAIGRKSGMARIAAFAAGAAEALLPRHAAWRDAGAAAATRQRRAAPFGGRAGATRCARRRAGLVPGRVRVTDGAGRAALRGARCLPGGALRATRRLSRRRTRLRRRQVIGRAAATRRRQGHSTDSQIPDNPSDALVHLAGRHPLKTAAPTSKTMRTEP